MHTTWGTTETERAIQTAAIRLTLTWIADACPDLYQLRLPGTRRRTPHRPLTRAARDAADALARIERAEQGLSVLGASRAPLDVGVLDTLADVLAGLVELTDRITMAAGAPDAEPPSTGYDFAAIERLAAHASIHLPAAAERDPGILDDTHAAATRLRDRLDRALTDIVDGHVLTTLCAWCRGTTTEAPAGGQRTLTVRVVAGDPLIVCGSDLCAPSDDDCGTWLYGRPAWRMHEWEWLSGRLDHAGGQVAS